MHLHASSHCGACVYTVRVLQVRVRAINTLSAGAWSPLVTVSTESARLPSVPGTPIRGPLSTGDSGITQIPVSWDAPSSIGLPILEYRLTLDGMHGFVTIGTYFVARGLQPASTHTFAVEARNARGWSPMSSTISLTTSDAVAPSAVCTALHG